MSSQHDRVQERGGFKYIRLKSGRLLSFWDAHRDAERAHTALATAVARAFKLAGNTYDVEHLESLVGRLEDYTAAIRREIDRLHGVRTKQERIALLRDTKGRSPQEAALFNAKADELEQRLAEETQR